MRDVHVKVHINAPIEQVFDAVSDHERFLRTDDGTATTLLRAGAIERVGLGCLREVKVGRRARYVEEVTAWQRPAYFEYTIREASMPIRHEVSRLTFTATGGGTDVEWTSRFSIPIPIIGGFLGAKAEKLYSRAFAGLLTAAKVRLETWKDPSVA